MGNKSLKSFVANTLVASSAVGTVTILSTTAVSAADCHIYNVNIQGTVSSNY